MPRFKNGWIKIHRRLDETDLAQDPKILGIWVLLLIWATRYETTINWQGKPRRIPEGSVVMGMKELAERFRMPKTSVHRLLHYLHQRGSIRLETGTRGTLITICNWKEYQKTEKNLEHGRNTDGTRTEHGRTLNGEEKKRRNKEADSNFQFSNGNGIGNGELSEGEENQDPRKIRAIIDSVFGAL